MNSKKYKDVIYETRPLAHLKELIDKNGVIFADRPAILHRENIKEDFKAVTYKQMRDDVHGFGTSLLMLGLQDKKVAIIGENSYKWLVSYFSIVNGMGIAVPIDRELKPKEIAALLDRAGVSGLIYSKKLSKKVMQAMEHAKAIKHLIPMDEIPNMVDKGLEAIEKGERGFVDAEVDPEQMAALLFTSGTTGLAKGVMLSHKNIVSNVVNMSKYVYVRPEDLGLSVLPMHHTYEMTCHICTGLYQGAKMAICDGLKYIQKNMQELHASIMLSVPIIFETMHKRLWKNARSQGKAKALRRMIELSKKLKLYNRPKLVKALFSNIHQAFGNNITLLIVGGAAINPKVIEDFQAMGFPMIQGYGITENSPIVAVNKDQYSKPEAVGLPLPGTQVRVVDQDQDGIGEIICKGPSVMLGYFNNPEATKEAIKDGWFYTGDYGRMDEEGFVYIAGRKKNVIVTKNGKNIFAEEIEYYLNENPYISESLVHGVPDDRNEDILVRAEIFPNREAIIEQYGDMSEEGIRDFIKEVIDEINDQIPMYKRIRRFGIREEEFEKTTTRKIKRHGKIIKSEDNKVQ